jgi:hypothetical protein
MRRVSIFVIIVMVMSFSSATAEQTENQAESVFHDYLNLRQPDTFLRIPGLDFSSSMGVSYFSSEGFGSTGMGYYMGHVRLNLTSSLILRCDVGVRSLFSGTQVQSDPQFFVPNVDLTYQPNKSFRVYFQYRQHTFPRYLYFR